LLVDRLLELFVVVGVLDYPVDRILLLVDTVGVPADNGAVLGNFISHQLLIDAQVVNLESSLCVGLVVLHQLAIKFVCSIL
jgi:hypothetical protein